MNNDQMLRMEQLLSAHAKAIRHMMGEIPDSAAKRNFTARASETAFWFGESFRAMTETLPDKTKSGIQVVKNV